MNAESDGHPLPLKINLAAARGDAGKGGRSLPLSPDAGHAQQPNDCFVDHGLRQGIVCDRQGDADNGLLAIFLVRVALSTLKRPAFFHIADHERAHAPQRGRNLHYVGTHQIISTELQDMDQ
jgi:hypothetical protein